MDVVFFIFFLTIGSFAGWFYLGGGGLRELLYNLGQGCHPPIQKWDGWSTDDVVVELMLTPDFVGGSDTSVANRAWICSGVLPFVSGRMKMPNKMPTKHKLPKTQNVPALVRLRCMSMKTLVTMNDVIQLVKATMLLPGPLNLAGMTSPATSQGSGPTPAANTAMKVMSNVIGTQPNRCAVAGSFSRT